MAEQYRDQLAKSIYGRLFYYLVNSINDYLQGQNDSIGYVLFLYILTIKKTILQRFWLLNVCIPISDVNSCYCKEIVKFLWPLKYCKFHWGVVILYIHNMFGISPWNARKKKGKTGRHISRSILLGGVTKPLVKNKIKTQGGGQGICVVNVVAPWQKTHRAFSGMCLCYALFTQIPRNIIHFSTTHSWHSLFL